ncbi:hypothetical protein [Polaromonas sp.]|uniref:hypothetical protein n=1 Tax=Polaromonas sp. TaxID=1869339 RepID=UPI001822F21F|nr:hypothetical protein [Polaromonas sp.]NML86522.1 hypothetical protein [Polaromonas sp.]
MFKLNAKLLAGAALCAVLLAGCGGDSDNNGNGGGFGMTKPPPGGGEQTINSVFEYIKNLIASNDENTDPIDINSLTLAADDTSESAALE